MCLSTAFLRLPYNHPYYTSLNILVSLWLPPIMIGEGLNEVWKPRLLNILASLWLSYRYDRPGS